ncbi:MAG: hypothetical protein ABEJ47_01940 [Halorhabdus sp.]
MRWRVLAVVVLIGLSGCSSLLGGGDTAPTLTPAPVPTDEPVARSEVMLAPGVFIDGELNTDRLSDAHRNILRNTSFVWTGTENRTGQVANVTASSVARRRVVFENASHYYFATNSRFGRYQGRRIFYPVYNEYADGEDVYVRALATSWSAYRFDRVTADGTDNRFVRSTSNAIERYLSVESVTVERIDTAGGARYRLTATEPSDGLVRAVDDYRVSAVVTPRGLVRNLTATYTTERTIPSGTVTFTYRYTSTITHVGNVTVQSPEWLPEAKRQLANESNGSGP